MKLSDIRLFDKQEAFDITERRLPHWFQKGALCFVTWRECDSLPRSVLVAIEQEISKLDAWVGERQKVSKKARWEDQVRRVFDTYEKYVDVGYGRCLLQSPKCASIVTEALLHFDEIRYFLTDFVIMPNHVHLIGAFPDQESFLKQAESWKRLTARRMNQILGIKGSVWKTDQFDHLIRSAEAFEYYRMYVAENPRKAGLTEGQFRHFCKQLD